MIRCLLLVCLLLAPSGAVAADKDKDVGPAILRSLGPAAGAYAAAIRDDRTRSRGLSAAIRAGDMGKVSAILRSQVLGRRDAAARGADLLYQACLRHGEEKRCMKARDGLIEAVSRLDDAAGEMRLAMSGTPLATEDSAVMLKARASLLQEVLSTELRLLRGYVAAEMRAKAKDPKEGPSPFDELEELAGITMLPPPPGAKDFDLKLGKPSNTSP